MHNLALLSHVTGAAFGRLCKACLSMALTELAFFVPYFSWARPAPQCTRSLKYPTALSNHLSDFTFGLSKVPKAGEKI